MRLYLQYYRDAVRVMKEHKALVALLLLLQAITMISFVSVGIIYEVKIIQDWQSLMAAFNTANYDPASLQEGTPFIQDWLGFQRSYDSLKWNFVSLLGWWSLIFILLQGSLWFISYGLVTKNWRRWKQYFAQFMGAAFLAIVPLSTLGFLGIKEMMAQQAAPEMVVLAVQGLAAIGVLFYYGAMVAWGFPGFFDAGRYNIPEKRRAKMIFRWKVWSTLAIRNMTRVFPFFILNVLVLSGSWYLLYWASTSRQETSLLLGAALLLILLLSLLRIVWIVALQQIATNTKMP